MCENCAKDQTLNALRDEATRIAVEHGFQDATVAEDTALIASEASELLEDHRDGQSPQRVWYEEKLHAFAADGSALMVDGKHARVAVRHEAQARDSAGAPRFKPCGIPSELADIVIRALHFAGKHGIDLEAAVREKMEYNATRPFKHGKVL